MSKNKNMSNFCQRLVPVGRILELKDWYVWGCSPVDGTDGKVHVLFSRWPKNSGTPELPMRGWLTHSEVAHAVADRPEGPYTVTGTVLKGNGGDAWDSLTIHNPTVHRIGDKYTMFYMGNSRPEIEDQMRKNFVMTKRIGLAVADSPAGPWIRVGDRPIIDVDIDPASWDSALVSNPAFCQTPDGKFMLFYKGMESNAFREGGGRRKYGLAIADTLEGPYRKYSKNPVLDYPEVSEGFEDAYVFCENNKFIMISRDMGLFSHYGGLLHESEDGIHWSKPQIAFQGATSYFGELGTLSNRGGQLERPQVLMRDGHPAYLFCAIPGGKYRTTSPAVFRIKAHSNERNI